MKIIKSSVEIIPQSTGIEGIYKAIELAGRTCYKSEDKMSDTSAKEFVERILKYGHGAMLEFGTVYLKIFSFKNPYFPRILDSYSNNKYSVITKNYITGIRGTIDLFITTNYRVIMQGDYKTWDEAQKNHYDKNWQDDLKYLCDPTEYHEKRVCVKFITDKGISHELVRHRVFSFAQESTRRMIMAA